MLLTLVVVKCMGAGWRFDRGRRARQAKASALASRRWSGGDVVAGPKHKQRAGRGEMSVLVRLGCSRLGVYVRRLGRCFLLTAI